MTHIFSVTGTTTRHSAVTSGSDSAAIANSITLKRFDAAWQSEKRGETGFKKIV
jgi:hypothetical protein